MASKQPAIWFGFAHEAYPSLATTTYRFSTRPFAASVFIEGRIPVDGWGAIARRASSLMGEYGVDTMDVQLRDTDGRFRELLASDSERWFKNRLASVELLSHALLNVAPVPAAGAALGKILFVGRCRDFQLGDEMTSRMDIEDIFSPYLDKTYPQYTLGDAYPFRFTLPSGDPIDEDLDLQASGYQIPASLRDQVMPYYFGPFISTEVDPVSGDLMVPGLLPTFFMGYTHLTAGSGTIGEPTPAQAALMAPFYTEAGWGGWGELFVCLGEMDIPNVYTSDLGTAPRRVINSADYGTTILAPGHAGWPFATDYVMRNGFRCMVIYVRGPLLWQHITRAVQITVDGCGWKNVDGVAIDQAGFAMQEFLNQHVFANGGLGYTAGPNAALQTYGTGDRALFWTSKIQEWQAMTATWLGTAKGYICSMPFHKPTTLREIFATWHRSFGAFSAKSGPGQWYPFGINDQADPATGVQIRERTELLRLPAPRIAWEETRNVWHWTYGWNPEQDRPRTPTRKVKVPTSIGANKQELREPPGSGTHDLKYTADDQTAGDVIGRKILRHAEAPRYQPLPTQIGGVDREIGEQVRVSHRQGIGAAGVGYVNQPMVILNHTQQKKDVTLEALDVARIIATSLNGPIDLNDPESGGQGWDWDTWPTP